MKKLLLIILLFSLSGCSNTVDLTAASDISATALASKYSQASEVKSKYRLEGVALKKTDIKNPELDKYKNEPKDEVQITIGDEALAGNLGATTEFKPNIELKRWNEVGFKLKTDKLLADVASKDKKLSFDKDKKLSFDKDKIKFDTPKMSFEMYDYPPAGGEGEGGYKYIWYLNEKPTTNKIEFEIESEGLDFCYQPRLDAQAVAEEKSLNDGVSIKWCDPEWVEQYYNSNDRNNGYTATSSPDMFRPENVVGSYAVYHSTKGGMNDAWGKEYKAGKAFQVPEPRIYDANGNFTRPEKFIINPTTGKYSITIPQEFLDTAVYPIKSNDTFGYTTNGASLTTIARNVSYSRKDQPVGALFTMASAGDVTKLSFGFKSTTDNTTAKGGIYAGSGSSPWAKQGGITNAATILTSDTAGFKDMTYASAVSLEAGSYRLLVKGDGNPMNSNYDNCSIGYDTGDASQGFIPKVSGEASDGTIDIHANITTGEEVGDYDYIGLNAYKISIYATYTPSAAPAATKSQQIIIFD